MKLRNLAALIFRIIGALFVLTGFSDVTSAIFNSQKAGWIFGAVGGLLIGFLMIYFSKKLAEVFCKGLDDDSA